MTDLEKELWIQNAEAHDRIARGLCVSIILNMITVVLLVWGVFTW